MILINATVKTSELIFYNDFGITTLNAKQFDTGRKFIFNIMDNDEPFDLTGCNVYLRIAKADGTQFQGNECCAIDASSVIIDTSVGNGSQILAASGINKCELHIEGQNGIGLTTWNFNIYVEARVHNGENISSIDSYDVLDNMISMEKDRIENEQLRIINERQRKENEEKRKDNEIERNTAESERQSSEAERKNTFNTVLTQAQSHATSASMSASNASVSEQNAHNSSLEAESWAHGNTGIRANENTNNSKFWCQQSETYKNASESLLNDATEMLQDINTKVADLNQKLMGSKFEISDDGELELEYESDSFDFEISDDGELEYWIIQEEI